MNKCIILVASLFLASLLHGQSDEVTLTVMGQGKTIEEAQQQAFRDAIMQTYGVFVSSNTEVANDKLKADTVNTITSGSVKKYDVISKTDLPDGSMALALRVVVSTQALGSFFESSGGSAKIAGGLFAFKMKQQQLNERNEVAAVKNMIVALKNILARSFDCQLEMTRSPSQPDRAKNEYLLPLSVTIKFNVNINSFVSCFSDTISAISLSTNELQEYHDQNREVFPVQILLRGASWNPRESLNDNLVMNRIRDLNEKQYLSRLGYLRCIESLEAIEGLFFGDLETIALDWVISDNIKKHSFRPSATPFVNLKSAGNTSNKDYWQSTLFIAYAGSGDSYGIYGYIGYGGYRGMKFTLKRYGYHLALWQNFRPDVLVARFDASPLYTLDEVSNISGFSAVRPIGR